MTQDQAILGANPKWVVDLKTWSRIGIVKEGKNKKSVVRKIPMMFFWCLQIGKKIMSECGIQRQMSQ